MGHKLTETTHVNADYTKVVPETDPAAAFVLGGKGQVISDELAEKLGLKAMEQPKANKAVQPSANKAATPLTEDFPAYSLLVAAGLHTVEDVQAVDDLMTIDGIGKVTAGKIKDELSKSG